MDAAHAVLSLTAARWRGLVESVPREALERPAGPGEWSALDCLRHLASGETVWTDRLRAYRDGQAELSLTPETDLEPGLSPVDLLAVLAERREEGLRLLAGLPDGGHTLAIPGAVEVTFTLDQTVCTWAGHDLQHTVQAEAALMQPLIQRSGWFRPMFADHDLEATTSRASP